MRKAALIAAALAAMLFLLPTQRASALEAFRIESYDFRMSVRSDNSYDITETVVMEYSEPRHGFYRDIPIRTPSGRRMRVTDVQVTGAPYETLYENGNFSIKIGGENTYADSPATYVISYRAIIGEDGIPDSDEVYYDLMGSQWDCYTDRFTFSVELPEAFSASDLALYRGAYGSSAQSGISYSISGNTVTGSAEDGLSPFEAVTLHLKLPEGYFKPAKTAGDLLSILSPILGILSVVAGILLYLKFGRNRRIFPPVEFYAPDGLTPADAGYIIDREAGAQDLTALILYWADKGYLHIYDDDNGKNLRLVKTQELPGDANIYEQTLFSGLFAHADPTGEVHVNRLKDRFYTTMSVAVSQLVGRWSAGASRIYAASASPCMIVLFVLACLCAFTSAAAILYPYLYPPPGEYLLVSAVAAVVFIAPIAAAAFFTASLQHRIEVGRAGAVFGIIVSLLVSAVFTFAAAYFNPVLALTSLVVCLILCFMGAKSKYKRTEYGDSVMARLLGFREFIRVAETDRIEKLVQENPQYYFNVLPYAIVFKLTDKWADKFRSLEMPAPSWYSGSGTLYNAMMFSHLSASMNRNLSTALTSRPAERAGGGGFGGGGGFSGGGSGGGGGRSW